MTAMRFPVDGRDQREMSPNLREAAVDRRPLKEFDFW